MTVHVPKDSSPGLTVTSYHLYVSPLSLDSRRVCGLVTPLVLRRFTLDRAL